MRTPLAALVAGLILAGCEERGTVESPDGPDNASTANPVEDPTAPVGPAWKTTSWATPRGNRMLDGRVDDPVPGKPEIAWEVELGSPIKADAGIADGVVYVGTLDGGFFALDARDGSKRWSFVAEDSIEGPPAIAADRVFIGSNDGFFYCLNIADGKVQWKVEGEDKFSSGAIVVPSPDGKEDWVVVNGYDGVCRCLRVKDGSEVWTYETGGPVNGCPALLEGGLIAFGGCDQLIHCVDLKDGSVRKEVELDAQITSSVATAGSVIYTGNYGNQVVAADVLEGKLLWTYEAGEFPFFASPALGPDYLYIGSRDKHLHAIDRKSGKKAWSFKTGARVDGSAIVFTDAVLVGSGDGRLYALSPEDGTERWRLDLGEGFESSPAFANGLIVLGGSDGTVFAITGSPSGLP